MPLYSWSVPGRKPGTSTSMTIGMLKQSQVRTNRAAFSEALMSRQPANWVGWLATMPDRAAVNASEADDDVGRVAGLHLEELVVVEDAGDDLVHVVGLVR